MYKEYVADEEDSYGDQGLGPNVCRIGWLARDTES